MITKRIKKHVKMKKTSTPYDNIIHGVNVFLWKKKKILWNTIGLQIVSKRNK